MKRTALLVKPYVWNEIPGHVVLFVREGEPGDTGETPISDWLQRFGGPQCELNVPFTGGIYRFDLTPWLHLPPETPLELRWGFLPEQPISQDDPRYPQPPPGPRRRFYQRDSSFQIKGPASEGDS
jgi:hypothetical protein